MDRVEMRVRASAEPVEVRQAGELRAGERLAFAYEAVAGRTGIGMAPVQVKDGGPVTPSPMWVWGLVTGVSEALWRSFPVVTEGWTVWVACEFGDQSSIITGIPRDVMIVTRRSTS